MYLEQGGWWVWTKQRWLSKTEINNIFWEVINSLPKLELKDNNIIEVKNEIKTKVCRLLDHNVKWLTLFEPSPFHGFWDLPTHMLSEIIRWNVGNRNNWTQQGLIDYMLKSNVVLLEKPKDENDDVVSSFKEKFKFVLDDLIEIWIIKREWEELSFVFNN